MVLVKSHWEWAFNLSIKLTWIKEEQIELLRINSISIWKIHLFESEKQKKILDISVANKSFCISLSDKRIHLTKLFFMRHGKAIWSSNNTKIQVL